jgi:hypothetical protein
MTSITPIGSYSQLFEGKQLKDFSHFNSQIRLARKIHDTQAKSSRRGLNAVVIKDHEGKTPGSVLCGLVYAVEHERERWGSTR